MEGTSLAVRQFVALLNGEVQPHAPRNERRALLMVEARSVCLVCGAEHKDVIIFEGARVEVCRCCLSEKVVTPLP